MSKQINYYLFFYNDGYIVGFTSEADQHNYEFYGQMADYPDVLESFDYGGWYKLVDGKFVEDAERKAEMIAKKERESTWEQRIDAQVTYTAMMTDTLIEEE